MIFIVFKVTNNLPKKSKNGSKKNLCWKMRNHRNCSKWFLAKPWKLKVNRTLFKRLSTEGPSKVCHKIETWNHIFYFSHIHLRCVPFWLYLQFKLHLGAKLKYEIPYYCEKFKTIRSNGPIRKRVIFGTFSSDSQAILICFRIILDRFHILLRLFGAVVVFVVTLFSASSSIAW